MNVIYCHTISYIHSPVGGPCDLDDFLVPHALSLTIYESACNEIVSCYTIEENRQPVEVSAGRGRFPQMDAGPLFSNAWQEEER